jgi:hypothetical protein
LERIEALRTCLRRVLEAEDFGAELPPEMKEWGQRWLSQIGESSGNSAVKNVFSI